MKQVFESSTALESHMIKNLLDNEGITSQIEGEYLQGGIGELQATGIVKVMVDDADYIAAKKIVDELESKQPAIDHSKPEKKGNTFIGFILGTVITTAVFLVIYNTPVETDGVDYDGDGFYEEKWIYKNDRLNKSFLDRNSDRSYDYKTVYDIKGLPLRTDVDDNFDGIFETKTYYKNGTIIREESDRNQNNIIDYRMHSKNGLIDTIEFIDENSGILKKRQYYKANKLVSAEFDSDGDGIFDVKYSYDMYEEEIK